MDKTDYEQFANFLKAVMEPYGRQLSPAVIAIWIDAMSDYSFAAVRTALSEYVKSSAGKFAPVPAHVIEVLQTKDGYPGADEAWAMLPLTEADTAVWTGEMSQAWGIALGLIESMFPAHAGMNRIYPGNRVKLTNVPRTRGDEPVPLLPETDDIRCSPHTRG